MKDKVKFIDLEEGIILMGYNISIQEAAQKMRIHQSKIWEVDKSGLLEEVELEPIYQLTTIDCDYDQRYSWEVTPQHEEDRIIGWVFQI